MPVRAGGRTWVGHHHVAVDRGDWVELLALVVDAHPRRRHGRLVRRARRVDRRRVGELPAEREPELPVLPLAAHVHHALAPLPRHGGATPRRALRLGSRRSARPTSSRSSWSALKTRKKRIKNKLPRPNGCETTARKPRERGSLQPPPPPTAQAPGARAGNSRSSHVPRGAAGV
jgi:hypothetical protein